MQFFMRDWMLARDGIRPQRQMRGFYPASILAVPNQGETAGCELYADLVSAPCMQTNANQRLAVLCLGKNAVGKPRLFGSLSVALVVHYESAIGVAVMVKAVAKFTLGEIGTRGQDGEIFLDKSLVILYHSTQRGRGLGGAPKHHHAARRGIQTVDGVNRPKLLRQNGENIALPRRIGLGRNALLLGDKNQMLVTVQYFHAPFPFPHNTVILYHMPVILSIQFDYFGC